MLPDDERYIGFLISDVARLLRTVFDRRMGERGLTRAQWLVLTRLARKPGASQSDLADMMEIEKASAGRLIDRLERNGWVERRADRSDRRVNRLFLTPVAKRLLKQIWPVAERTVDEALSALSASERRQLTGLMARVKSRAVQMAGEAPGRGNGRAAARGRLVQEVLAP